MSTHLDRLKAALSDRYTVEREIGRGGMATVYLARDLKHERQVAVKVLRPELAAALGPERFLREIKIAANLNHPHILPLHDSGEADGFLFYVMPYVKGESLRDRLNREKQLPIDDALKIASEVADALGFAHEHNVVHRDIKPENILLVANHAAVTDFGVARAIEEAGETRLTETGIAIGTPAYLSPEQASGERELDGRSDVYSLGCVLYEMLAGQPPFTGPTAESVLRQHLTADPPSVTTIRPSVPSGIAEGIRQALAKTPADRFKTTAEFRDALPGAPAVASSHRWLPIRLKTKVRERAFIIAVTAAVVLTAGLLLRQGRTHTPAPDRVFVAPFENRTGVDTLDVLGAILADYVGNQLVRTGIVDVVPARAVRGLPNRAVDSTTHGHEFAQAAGVGIVIAGAYYLQLDSLVIEGQIIDAMTSRVISAVGPLGGATREPMRTASLFAQRLTGALAVVVDPKALPAAVSSPPPSYDVYRDYVEAVELFWEGEYEDVLRLVYRALEADSTFAPALRLAAAAEMNGGNLLRADSVINVAERYRPQLVPLDAIALDYMQAELAGDREGALRASRRGAELLPGRRGAAGREALRTNRPHEAIEQLMSERDLWKGQRGMVRFFWDALTQGRHMIGDHPQELYDARLARDANPGDPRTLDYEIRALAALGMADEVQVLFDSILATGPQSGWDPGGSLREAAVVLRAHEHRQLAREALDKAVDWYRALPETVQHEFRLIHAQTLYVAGRWVEAKALLDSLRLAGADPIDVQGWQGTLAARLGNAEAARHISDALGFHDRHYLYGRPTLWRARIASVLGEREHAVSLLRQAYGEGLSFGVWLLYDIDFESLHDYPPFQEFLRPKG